MAGWLHLMDSNGARVARDFYERLRTGQTSAKRALAKTDLTARYREGHGTLTPRQMQPGLFWNDDTPDHILIPLVYSRHSPPAWLPDYVTYRSKRVTRKVQREVAALARGRGTLYPALQVKYQDGGVTAMALKPNPKFELVVVNKHDRSALLNLLAALDNASSVETWLAERTTRTGATQADALYDAYREWCAKRGETPTGSKTFSQSLVAAGVVKLPRGQNGSRYALELRPL